MKRFSKRLRNIFSSDTFFYTVVGIFMVSASWVAITSLYPMAFDEDFHIGLIKLYASSWLPYGIELTPSMAKLGAATADASYLMHYLLSFPYRLMVMLSIPSDAIVIVLRLLNVGFFVAGLVVFKKGLAEIGVSRAITHIGLTLFTLIPVAPLLAGQVNYDNPLLLIVALTLLFSVRIFNRLKTDNTLAVGSFWGLTITALIGVSVKFAYAAILAAFLIWLTVVLVRSRATTPARLQVRRLIEITKSFSLMRKLALSIGIGLGCLFSAHYAVTFVQYGSLTPACDDVFSEQACMQYGPYARNAMLKAERPTDFQPLSFIGYLATFWVPDMGERLTFALAGPTNDYQTKQPLELFYAIFMTLGLIGVTILLLSAWFLRGSPLVWVSLLLIVLYVVPLAVRLYGSYVTHAQPIAINGRYLLPILPLVIVTIMTAPAHFARRMNTSRLLPYIAAAVLALFVVTGGGVSTYIVLAEPSWLFRGWAQQSHAMLQSILQVLILR